MNLYESNPNNTQDSRFNHLFFDRIHVGIQYSGLLLTPEIRLRAGLSIKEVNDGIIGAKDTFLSSLEDHLKYDIIPLPFSRAELEEAQIVADFDWSDKEKMMGFYRWFCGVVNPDY
jgi:hypothetical protein